MDLQWNWVRGPLLAVLVASTSLAAGCSEKGVGSSRDSGAANGSSAGDAGTPEPGDAETPRDAQVDGAAMVLPAEGLTLPLEPVTSLDVETRYDCDVADVLPYVAETATWTKAQHRACFYGTEEDEALCPIDDDGPDASWNWNCLGQCDGWEVLLSCFETTLRVCKARTGCAQEVFDRDCCERAYCGELTRGNGECQMAAYGTGAKPGPCVAAQERAQACGENTGCGALAAKLCDFTRLP